MTMTYSRHYHRILYMKTLDFQGILTGCAFFVLLHLLYYSCYKDIDEDDDDEEEIIEC